jgi:hypothetical protein
MFFGDLSTPNELTYDERSCVERVVATTGPGRSDAFNLPLQDCLEVMTGDPLSWRGGWS